jgi:hypothetical protein
MKKNRRFGITLAACLGIGAAVTIILNVFADAPPPALTISSLGTNQFSLVVTNGVGSGTNYEIYWTPVLNDAVDYPWTLITVGSTGQTNFPINAAGWSVGFFRASFEQFYSGIPDYELADPNNPSLGPLTITIDSPLNGATFN